MFNYDHWYVASMSNKLTNKPLGVKLLGISLVLFKSGEDVVALEDRCPHKNVPLSLGSVSNGKITCSYHGWKFNQEGVLDHIPSQDKVFKCGVKKYPAKVLDGLVWVFMNPSIEAPVISNSFPIPKGYASTTYFNQMIAPADLILENAFDCTHTAFVHDGLFRSRKKLKKVQSTVVTHSEGVDVDTIEPETTRSLAMGILGPGQIVHKDSYHVPNTVRVDYWKGKLHNITVLHVTPITKSESLVFTRMDVKGVFGFTNIINIFLKVLVNVVIKQDKKILEAQAKCIEEFGGRSFTSVKADLASNTFFQKYDQVHGKELNQRTTSREVSFNI